MKVDETWLMRVALLEAVSLGGLAGARSSQGRFPPLRRVPLFEQPVTPDSPTARIVNAARIAFAPGQPTGRHRHPVTVAVTRGAFSFQIKGQAKRMLKAGDAFLEPAGAEIVRFDNASASGPPEIVAFYLTDSEARPLIEMLPETSHGR